MKTFLLFFFTLLAFSQYNDDKKDKKNTVIVKEIKDEFTNESIILTDSWNRFGKSKISNYLTGNIRSNKGFTIFVFQFNADLGCLIKESSTIKIKLENDNFIDMIYFSETECNDRISGIFIPLKKEELTNPDFRDIVIDNLNKLKESPWKMIRIEGSRFYVDIYPNTTNNLDKPQNFFIDHITALDNFTK